VETNEKLIDKLRNTPDDVLSFNELAVPFVGVGDGRR
jgi:hypothetical protein